MNLWEKIFQSLRCYIIIILIIIIIIINILGPCPTKICHPFVGERWQWFCMMQMTQWNRLQSLSCYSQLKIIISDCDMLWCVTCDVTVDKNDFVSVSWNNLVMSRNDPLGIIKWQFKVIKYNQTAVNPPSLSIDRLDQKLFTSGLVKVSAMLLVAGNILRKVSDSWQSVTETETLHSNQLRLSVWLTRYYQNSIISILSDNRWHFGQLAASS